MAILQISQMQVRRGLNQDLPQLASGELGWSLDTRQLYIGNGTIDEGAPSTGLTEILTQYSDFYGFSNSYTFAGADSGFTSQTGTTLLSPVTRSLQSVLDDHINAKDFGAAADGVTDDTAALNRLIQQIYLSSLNGVHLNVQRTVKISAGKYLISSPLLLPPNLTLVGDGINNTVIYCANGTVIETCDSLYQTSTLIGTNSATIPGNITIKDIQFASGAGTNPIALIDSANGVGFDRVAFVASAADTNVVTTAASAATTYNVTFRNCLFSGGVTGFSAIGATNTVRILHSEFLNCSSYGINRNSFITGLVSDGNYFTGVPTPITGLSANNYSFGDTTTNVADNHGGLYSGSAKYGIGQDITLSSGINSITNLGSAGQLDYQLLDGSGNYRFGTIHYNTSNGVTTFDEEFNEPATGLGANVYVWAANAALTCTVTNSTSTFRYNIKSFV